MCPALARHPNPQAPAVSIEGILERVTYANEENGWSVIRVAVRGRKELVAAVGNLLGVQPGESLRLWGVWVQDRQYGEQFRAERYTTLKPATLMGMEKYLGSGMVKGVGKALAARIVRCFGLATLDVIDQTPDRLSEVEGIGPIRTARIKAAWQEQREIREVMVFLQAHGVSTLLAVKIYKHYGAESVHVVSKDPYRLALEIYGIGFKTADKIARSLGVAADSPRRAEAGVLHVLGEHADEGHTFLPRPELIERTGELLEVPAPIIDPAIDRLRDAGHVAIEARVGQEAAVFSAALHAAEVGTAHQLRDLGSTPTRPLAIDVPKAIAWFEAKSGMTLAPEQRQAVEQAMTAKVLVITGGPGTGKTTLVKAILQILAAKRRRIVLAAPTGRAAKRMTEATGWEAKTIHRLLEFSPADRGFKRNQENPLDADVIVLDETSMLDTVIANSFLKAVPPQAQLLLVGDVDQLPSVGPGSVLRDVIESGAVPVVRLTQIFRQGEASQIVVNAHRINAGQFPAVESRPDSDFHFVERAEPEAILATVKTLLKERIPGRYRMDAVDDIQVLTPMNRGVLGTTSLNAELQSLLNPSGPEVVRGSRTLRVGDKVMQLRNNYDLDVYNGDLGRVRAVDDVEHELRVVFDGREVTYPFSDLDELTLAYACSIHKSQGSEYPAVVIPLHTSHYVMLARNLLYTGITRGKRLVVLVGTKKALAMAVKNARAGERFTRLAHRLSPTGISQRQRAPMLRAADA